MATGAETRVEDYLGLLGALAREGEDVLIVGGHAVNLWAELYLAREPELSEFLPFTSRDLDLHRLGRKTASAFRRHGARMTRSADPFGKVFDLIEAAFSLELPDGRTLNVEALRSLPGLTPREITEAAVQVEYRGLRLSVPHPIALLKAKAHNLAHLEQTERQDRKHFQILMLCVRAFLREWLSRCERGEPTRQVLDLLELTLKTLGHPEVLQATQALGRVPKHALPLTDLAQSQNRQILRFLAERIPRWDRSISRELGAQRPRSKSSR